MHNYLPYLSSFLFLSISNLPSTHSLSLIHNKSNRLFLDTAILSDWKSLLPIGIFHGITTNPTLLEQAGHECTIPSIHNLATQALSIPNCHEFMCQTWGETCDEMYYNGMALSEINRKDIVIKVPVTFEGTKAASKLMNSGVRVCLTACYNSDQMIIALGLGVDYIAPYLGRMTDNGKNGSEECYKMQLMKQNGLENSSNANNGANTRVLVASIRNVKSMADLMAKNMDTFTFSPDVARQLFYEQLTVQAAADFEAAAIRCHATSIASPSLAPSSSYAESSSSLASSAAANAKQEEMTNQLQEELENSQLQTQMLQNDIQTLKEEITSNQDIIAAYRQSSNRQAQSVTPKQQTQPQPQPLPQKRTNNVLKKKKNKQIFKWSD